MILARLVGADPFGLAYYGNTVSSPLALAALGEHPILQKTLTQLGIFAIFAAPVYAIAALTMVAIGQARRRNDGNRK